MKSMSSSNQLKMLAKNINSQQLRIFLLIIIDRVHKQEILFFCSLLRACIDNHDYVINDLNLDLANNIPLLYSNMINPLVFE